MEFKGVIFDLDGTLADSIEDIGDSMNRVLSAQGFPVHDYASYKYFVGKGVRNLVMEALPLYKQDEDIIERCHDLMVSDYRANCLVKTRLYDGIPELLQILKKNRVPMAVFSNKKDELTKIVVEALAGNDYFEVVLGARPDIPPKPDPAGALLISERLGIAPAEIIYLGDTDVDMKTANRAGMIAAGASWGFRTERELTGSGAHLVLRHPLDLLNAGRKAQT